MVPKGVPNPAFGVPKSIKNGAILDYLLARKSIKNYQNWCLGHPGCRIKGKEAIWDAKWRGKDRLGEKNGGEKDRFGSTVAEPALAHWIPLWEIQPAPPTSVPGPRNICPTDPQSDSRVLLIVLVQVVLVLSLIHISEPTRPY